MRGQGYVGWTNWDRSSLDRLSRLMKIDLLLFTPALFLMRVRIFLASHYCKCRRVTLIGHSVCLKGRMFIVEALKSWLIAYKQYFCIWA